MDRVVATGLILLLARLLLCAVFINAALPKIADPVAFAASIDAYRVTSGALSMWVATILPWLELVIALGILSPWLLRSSALIIASLLSLFIALHASAWARGLDINCGCFGSGVDSPGYHWLILRNLGLLVVCVFVLKHAIRNKKPRIHST
jgi:uncharacterized membrane protein YphA (DoxX/SURF4 family)